MKKLLEIIFAVLFLTMIVLILAACSGPRHGCGTENYRKPFRVYRVIRHPDGTGMVIVRRYRDRRELRYECLPDSIVRGSYVNLKPRL